MSRQEFLDQHWKSYPAMPSATVAYGRLHGLDPQNGKAQLIRDGQLMNVQLFSLIDAPISWTTEQWAQCLRAGDVLAVLDGGMALLLAPALVEVKLTTADPEVLTDWSKFLVEVRKYFTQTGFSELATPGLVVCPGTEPSLDVFQTEFQMGSQKRALFLPTSPELHLKKALASGFSQIFEIKSCYRNGEITDRHQPEFTLLEWYRAWDHPKAIQEDALGLVDHLIKNFPARTLHKPKSIRRARMADLFQDAFGEPIFPGSSLTDYQNLARKNGIAFGDEHTIDDLFFLLFTEKIEANFDPDVLMIVEDWPPFQAALARLTPDGWGDRFEIYWRGFELANAFHELNDPEVQKKRFEEDLAKKAQMGKPAIPLDADFLRALKGGMPPSAGIALGLERLFMAMFGVARISDLKLFPYR